MNAEQRRRDLEALTHERVDLLVVGGGVTGCGVALDAASRGLSVALVERGDLASGTSGWSSKLVHGGLRYLAQGDLRLARESARERGILMGRTAPHLVRELAMAVPFVPGTPRRLVATGHTTAHVLGLGTAARLPRPRHLSTTATLALLPALSPAGLRGSHVNHDGQLEDDVRFVIALARTAESLGARIVTGAAATRIDGEGADVVVDGVGMRIEARAVVNAAGVWSGSLDPDVRLTPSKGAHLVVRAAALGHPTAAMAVAVPGEHNRYVFALPHPDGLVYVGLTDDALAGDPPDVVDASVADTDFLLATIGAHLRTPLTGDDVVGSFAGLRPLIAGAAGSTADLSRRHAVTRATDGAWTVVGGKLTTYRLMAQDAVDATGLADVPCRTTDLPLLGAARIAAARALPARLIRRYGSEAAQVAAAGPLEPVAAGVPVLRCELAWGIAAEGARTVEDLLARRTRLGFVREWAAAARPAAEAALATVRS